MRQIRLYTPQSLTAGATVELDDRAANHLVKVLRARVGDPVVLFNGEGLDVSGTVLRIEKRVTTIALTTSTAPTTESPLQTHLGLCLSKGDRFDWAVQKAVELGVSSITPLFSERVEMKLPAERQGRKQQHWQHIAISACEQSGRVKVPTVNEATTLTAWVSAVEAEVKLVLHHHQPGRLPRSSKPASAALLIGPEGGLTEPEVSAACASGFMAWRLGPRVMRTETAPVAALALLAWQWGDFQAD